MDSGSWYRKSQNPQRREHRAHAPRPTVLILLGSHGHSSCLGGQKGYLKPRLAVQSSQSRPQPHYNLPHKAIYVVWQHSSHKQREHTDSRIAKGSGLIFFRTSDFFEFDCNFSNTLMPALPQSTRGFRQSPPLQATLPCPWLEVSPGGEGGTGKTPLVHGQVNKRSCFSVLGLFSSWYNQNDRGKKTPKNNKTTNKSKIYFISPPPKVHITHDQRLRGCINGCWHNPACPSPLPQVSTGSCGQAPVSPG